MPIGASHQAIHSIYIYDGFRLMNPVLIIRIHSIINFHISIPYSLSYHLFKYILNLRTHLIYSFMYSFHSYLVNYQNTLTKNRVREQICKDLKRGIGVGRTNPKIFALRFQSLESQSQFGFSSSSVPIPKPLKNNIIRAY